MIREIKWHNHSPHAMGVIGNAVPFHVVIFAGGRTVQVQPFHTWIVRTVQHFLLKIMRLYLLRLL